MTNREVFPPTAGDVVIIRLYNSLENAAAQGKQRPAVLVARKDGHWITMGLTTNPMYRSGSSRTAIPNPNAVGLRRPGYLWGSRLANVSAIDVGDWLGRVDTELAEAIIQVAGLHGWWASNLRTAALGSEAA